MRRPELALVVAAALPLLGAVGTVATHTLLGDVSQAQVNRCPARDARDQDGALTHTDFAPLVLIVCASDASPVRSTASRVTARQHDSTKEAR